MWYLPVSAWMPLPPSLLPCLHHPYEGCYHLYSPPRLTLNDDNMKKGGTYPAAAPPICYETWVARPGFLLLGAVKPGFESCKGLSLDLLGGYTAAWFALLKILRSLLHASFPSSESLSKSVYDYWRLLDVAPPFSPLWASAAAANWLLTWSNFLNLFLVKDFAVAFTDFWFSSVRRRDVPPPAFFYVTICDCMLPVLEETVFFCFLLI